MSERVRISIVDDQPIFRGTIKNIINDFTRFDFTSEHDNDQSFIEFLKTGIVPDLVIIDLHADVGETIAYLKKNFPQMKVLVLSLYGGEVADCQRARRETHEFLIKKTLQQYDMKQRSR